MKISGSQYFAPFWWDGFQVMFTCIYMYREFQSRKKSMSKIVNWLHVERFNCKKLHVQETTCTGYSVMAK